MQVQGSKRLQPQLEHLRQIVSESIRPYGCHRFPDGVLYFAYRVPNKCCLRIAQRIGFASVYKLASGLEPMLVIFG